MSCYIQLMFSNITPKSPNECIFKTYGINFDKYQKAEIRRIQPEKFLETVIETYIYPNQINIYVYLPKFSIHNVKNYLTPKITIQLLDNNL